MTWHFSKVSLLYAKEPTAGWLRHAIEGIDESLATLCRQHGPTSLRSSSWPGWLPEAERYASPGHLLPGA